VSQAPGALQRRSHSRPLLPQHLRRRLLPRGPTDLFSSAGFLIKLLLLWTGALLVLALAGLLVVLPVSMFLAQGVLLALWKIFGRATGLDFGPLWFERYSMEVQPSWPAYIAIYSFAILMLFRTGIWFVRSPQTSR
jgi:hypothetical protein